MRWYAAHIITYLKYLDGLQAQYEAYDNIVLVGSETPEDAFTEASQFGKQYELDVTVGPENRPARWTFAGIRSLVECQPINHPAPGQPPGFIPTHGTEVSYNPLLINGEEALARLVNGESVSIVLEHASSLNSYQLAEHPNPHVETKLHSSD
jgi:hypothetical protein